MDIGKNIAEAIKSKGIRKADVAKALRVKRSSVTNWCKGKTKPTLENAVQMAELLGIRLDHLVNGMPKFQGKKIGLDDPLPFDLALVMQRRFCFLEGEDMPTVRKVMEQAYGEDWQDECAMIAFENPLSGIVVYVGNHEGGVPELVGETEGYA